MESLIIHIIPAILLAFITQLLLHELGHMFFGNITGWNFIYLQIYNIAIVKAGIAYKTRLVSSHAFQCIMSPKDELQKADLYTLGGCIFNFFSTIAALWCMVVSYQKPVLWFYSWCFLSFGIALFLINIIPNTKRLCNDGECYRLLRQDEATRQCHNMQLMAAGYLYIGKTYKQIGLEVICPAPEHTTNDILAYQSVLEFYYWLEMDNYEMMKKALDKVNLTSAISENVSDIIGMERLFADIYYRLKDRKLNLKHMPDNYEDIYNYIKSHEKIGDVHSLRIKATFESYEEFIKDGCYSAVKRIDSAIENIQSMACLYLGEAAFCIEQLNRIKTFIGRD